MFEVKFSAAVFDLDGTLIDSMPYWRSLLTELLEDRGLSADGEAGRELERMSLSQGLLYLQSRFFPEESLKALRKEVERRILAIYRRRCRVKPGVREFLEELKAKGIPMGIATVSDRGCAKRALRRLGLKGYFSCLLTDEDVGKGKDQPDLYLAAAKKLRVQPESCAVFEDSLLGGKTAKEAGFLLYAVEDSCNGEVFSRLLEIADGKAPW